MSDETDSDDALEAEDTNADGDLGDGAKPKGGNWTDWNPEP
jgi:hypothetical protein